MNIRKSTWFLVVFMVCLLLSPLLINMANNLILRGELREALEDFIEEYCDEEIEIYKINYPLNTRYMWRYYQRWTVDTSSDEHFFEGELSIKSLDISLNSSCSKKDFSFIKEISQFESTGYLFPAYGIVGIPRNRVPYYAAFIIGVAIWWWLLRREKDRV